MENLENKDWKRIKEIDENKEEEETLRTADLAKGDFHSSSESDIPLGVEKEEYIKSFDPQKEEKEYFDTGIRPRVDLPDDESDEFQS